MNKQLKILLVFSLMGILVLLFISSRLEPSLVNIQEITEKDLGSAIKLKVEIINLQEFPDKYFQILILKDKTGNITAISNSKTTLLIDKNKTYLIYGRVQAYNDTLQININKIIK